MRSPFDAFASRARTLACPMVWRALAAVLLLAAAPLIAGAVQRDHPPDPNPNDPFAAASKVMNEAGTLPTFIEFASGNRPQLATFVQQFLASLPLSPDFSFRVIRSEGDQLGETHIRLQQLYQGLPVLGGEYIVHARNGSVRAANGRLAMLSGLDPAPAVDAGRALDAALAQVGARSYKWQIPFWVENLKERTGDPNATWYPAGELCWSPTAFGQPETPARYVLAWQFDINAADPDRAIRVIVDAKTGAIVTTLPLESNCSSATVQTNFNGNQTIFTQLSGSNYLLRDDCQSAGIHVRDWNSATLVPSPVEIQNTTNTWTTMNERFGGTVLWSTKQSYLYYLNTFGRNSYDNSNGSVEGYINAQFDCSPPAGCVSPDNASMSFSGGTLKVGLGSSGTLANSWSAIDILGHEYTHAVTGATAMLAYMNESGALNESFSDCMGEAIQNYTTGSVDWLEGANRSSGPIRSLANPKAFSNPDTYLGTYWYTGSGDFGGVHTNSGVQNKWYYLVAVGGSGTNDNGWAYSVTGIGLAKAAAITYRNLTVYLSSGSTYTDARTGAIAAAADLYGAGSQEWKTVIRAWRAVGIDPCHVNCPSNVVQSNDAGLCGATVNYSAPTDNGLCFSVTASPPSGSFFPVATTPVTATSVSGASCSFNVTVNDTENPHVTCPAPVTVECTSHSGTPASDPGIQAFLNGFVATDNCPGVTKSNNAPVVFPLGATQVIFTGTDASTNTSSCASTVNVVDTTPPAITVSLDRTALWPPNHKLVTINATVTVSDVCDPNPTFELVSIVSSEPDNGLGDGDTSNDIQGASYGTPDTQFQLRSERSGTGPGRTYTITYRVMDHSGNHADAVVVVRVAHDQGAAAQVATGWDEDGTGFAPNSTQFAMVVRSIPRTVIDDSDPVDGHVGTLTPSAVSLQLDTRMIDVGEAYVGNTAGAVAPVAVSRGDVDGDGLQDLVCYYDVQAVLTLQGNSTADDGPIGLHFAVGAMDYLVPDIFACGSPIVLPDMQRMTVAGGGGRGTGRAASGTARSGTASTQAPAPSGAASPAVATPAAGASAPLVTELAAVYPNPVHDDATAVFTLARDQSVDLAVYDLRGARVRTLAGGIMTTGRHFATWNGRDDAGRLLSRGMYFVRFYSQEAHSVRKVALTR